MIYQIVMYNVWIIHVHILAKADSVKCRKFNLNYGSKTYILLKL